PQGSFTPVRAPGRPARPKAGTFAPQGQCAATSPGQRGARRHPVPPENLFGVPGRAEKHSLWSPRPPACPRTGRKALSSDYAPSRRKATWPRVPVLRRAPELSSLDFSVIFVARIQFAQGERVCPH